jgi:hypothetical protein
MFAVACFLCLHSKLGQQNIFQIVPNLFTDIHPLGKSAFFSLQLAPMLEFSSLFMLCANLCP